MGFRKEMNKFIAWHSKGIMRATVVFMVVWFVSALLVVDSIDPYLFIGVWMPIGAIAALFCSKW
ncbi:MAG: hypothetical protein HY461_02285 [Parcubacteria group bacterium]|nr:hypothetical protein [Parcubacteria group bacterium]